MACAARPSQACAGVRHESRSCVSECVSGVECAGGVHVVVILASGGVDLVFIGIERSVEMVSLDVLIERIDEKDEAGRKRDDIPMRQNSPLAAGRFGPL
jgi:hypothetical protein